mmetsp:Transcript_60453/g.91164  ORF Transcript_60453/g.91164 Transcript_60453/m.91164 type:complete len:233 (-) Transcript_60453:64-762(-)
MKSTMNMMSLLFFALLHFEGTAAFSTTALTVRQQQHQAPPSTTLLALYPQGRSTQRGGKAVKSKRQERVGQLVQTEVARILHSGNIKGDSDFIDGELRKRISIVSVDVSPDLRQARISVSVRASGTSDDNPVVDKRRAYSWLVRNTKPLRHTLAQRMSHMKSSPNLSFVQVDVGAAVDVMYLIDKVTKGYERGAVGEFGGDDNTVPKGYVSGMDFDEEFEEDEWDEEDEDFF